MKNPIYLLGAFILLAACSNDDSGDAPIVSDCTPAEINTSTAVNFNNPCAVAVHSSGMIAVSVYNGFDDGYGAPAQVWVATSLQNFQNGNFSSILSAIAPEGLAFDSAGNLYVAETEQAASVKIFKLEDNDSHTHLRTIQSDFNNPRGMSMDSNDRLFLADDGNGRVVRFDDPYMSNDYTVVGMWGAGIKSVAVKDDVLYVVNYNHNTVTRNTLNADGSLDVEENEVTIFKATDISVNGNSVVVTSFDDATVTVFSHCDFNNENKTGYNNLGQIFGTAFISGSQMMGAQLNTDKVTLFTVNN